MVTQSEEKRGNDEWKGDGRKMREVVEKYNGRVVISGGGGWGEERRREGRVYVCGMVLCIMVVWLYGVVCRKGGGRAMMGWFGGASGEWIALRFLVLRTRHCLCGENGNTE